jgi:hypothetical protein
MSSAQSKDKQQCNIYTDTPHHASGILSPPCSIGSTSASDTPPIRRQEESPIDTA